MSEPNEYANLLQQEIARLREREQENTKTIEALKQEFADSENPDDIVKIARKAIRTLMPRAIVELGNLIDGAESEAVRGNLSKFVVSVGLDKSKFEDDSAGSLKTLLEGLAKNDPKVAADE